MAGLAVLIETLEGFEWDVSNSEKNRKRHRITQAECEQIFANLPLLLSVAIEAASAVTSHSAARTVCGNSASSSRSEVRGFASFRLVR